MFKKGQQVYGRSDWFASSYVPEIYTIRDVKIVDGKAQYYVKRRKNVFNEDELYATEAEAQVQEVKRFVDNKKQEIADIQEQMQKYGVTLNAKLFAEKDFRDTSKPVYDVGEIVYGHMDGGAYGFMPEQFVIKQRECVENSESELKYHIYYVKRHGQRVAYEDYLFPTYKEALIADLIRFRVSTKSEVRSLWSRVKNLCINKNEIVMILSDVLDKCDSMLYMDLHSLTSEDSSSNTKNVVIHGEANAIMWIKQQLHHKEKTYGEILSEWSNVFIDKIKEDIVPKLEQLLEENFVKQENGKWRLQNIQDDVDKTATRTKSLLREFKLYKAQAQNPNVKINKARIEALRAGFKDCYIRRDYKTIVMVGDKIPQNLRDEDEVLLQFYDIASNKIE